MSNAKRLRLGLPKGTLQDTTGKLLALAGYQVSFSGRTYYPPIDDPEIECVLIRAQEMARYVEQGVMDCGITGLDWVVENKSKVKELADLEAPWPNYRPIRWVLAVKEDSRFKSVKDLQGKRIATDGVGITRAYLKKHGVKAEVEFSWGATEVKPPILADAIVDITETGSGLRQNELRVIDEVMVTTPRFIANREAHADAWKRKKMENFAMLLRGAINAASRVGLMMNLRREKLDAIVKQLPALATPTISALADERWVAINTVVDEKLVRELIPRLSEAGAQGIVEYPLNKIVE
jgi:ATP phosphoribosyltransferase